MNRLKVIHLMGSSPPLNVISKLCSEVDFNLPKHRIKTDYFPYWAGFPDTDFSVRVAKTMLTQSDKYEVECWRPYFNLREELQMQIDGVKHRIFPLKEPNVLSLGNYKMEINSYSSEKLINALTEESKKNRIILHLHGFPGGHNMKVLQEFPRLKVVPIVVQHRGGSFSYSRKRFSESFIHNIFSPIFKLKDFINYKRFFESIDICLSNTIYQAKIFSEFGGKNIFLHKDGINYEDFAPKSVSISNKIKILFVGGFTKDKGLDKLIEAYKILIEKGHKFELILVGGHKDDELYDLAISSGSKVYGRVDYDKISDFFQKADLNVFITNRYRTRFAGLGRSFIEGWACNIPVISNQLIPNAFAGTKKELMRLGETFSSFSSLELSERILKVMNSYDKYKNCRKLSRKYYDFNKTIKRNFFVYDYLERKYYN